MKIQRLRVMFARGEEVKYITHLDLMRFWERALRRAQIPVAYSEGFSPHAQISLAAPLPVGTTGEGELMDVFLAERIPPKSLLRDVSRQLPAGLTIVSVEEAGVALPALQAEVRFAEYEVDVAPGPADVSEAIERFMAAESVPWEHKREDELRSYDIRPLVDRMEVLGRHDNGVTLRMRLKNDSGGSGRPEQVTLALGLGTPMRIHRTKLVLGSRSPSRDAWRKRGRFAG